MKVEQIRLIITKIQDGTDKDGNVVLKCKGYNSYKINGKNGYNFFSNISLYPVSQEQYEETKNRLFSQTVNKPKLKIIAYQNELVTPLYNGKVLCNLIVYRFDFARKKLFKKKQLLNYGKENNKNETSK